MHHRGAAGWGAAGAAMTCRAALAPETGAADSFGTDAGPSPPTWVCMVNARAGRDPGQAERLRPELHDK